MADAAAQSAMSADGDAADRAVSRVDQTSVAVVRQHHDVEATFAMLLADRHRVVPVVGAGLALAAGVPGLAGLAEYLRNAAGHSLEPDTDLYELADKLAGDRGSVWVNRHVAEAIRANPPRATNTLRALVRLPTRIIATTNYDDAIERAAAAVGLTPRPFHGATLNQGLRRPADGELHVLHLHGHHATPESLVLDRRSYERALDDEALTFALRQLTSEHMLVFLGQRLASEERDLRRDLLWSVDTFTESGPHHVLLPAEEGPRPDLEELAARGAAIVVTPFENRDGRFEVVDLAAQHLGLGAPPAGRTLPADLHALRTERYMPIPIAPADELSDASQRRAWELAGSAFGRHIDLADVLTHRCAVLFGAPGSGKTQTMLAAALAADRKHVVFKALREVHPRSTPVSAVDEFVTWVRTGRAMDAETPDPTRNRLRDTVYLFLLDGLDEVPRNDRDRVLTTVAEVAETHPNLQFLVSSRPYHGALDAIPAGFDAFELVPDRSWFHEYAEHVGVSDQQLARVLPDDALLQDLVRLPVFAVAVVDAALRGERLPDSPIEAILHVARTGLEDAPTLPVAVDDLTGWLDTLALVAEARTDVGLPADLATDPTIANPFGLAPDDQLLDELVQRALVVSTGGTVGFPATVVQEARAARALLHSTRGLDLLRRHALLTLEDGTRGVHPSWRHVLELACLDAPGRWRDVVAEFDARLAARATPRDADQDERAAALTTLLDWYSQRLVWWIDHDDEAQLLPDLDALVRLADDPQLRTRAVDWAIAGLDDPERTRRGNALRLLLRLGETDTVEQALPELLRDPHSVVRRFAAHAHAVLKLTGHAHLLRTALDDDPDELEERGMLGEYIRTAPVDELTELLATRWPSEMNSHRALTELDARLDRRTQLHLLEQTGWFAEPWVDHLIDQVEPPWTADDAAALAAHLARHPTKARWHTHRARPILRQHLAASLPALWASDPTAARRLLLEASTAELCVVGDAGLPVEIAAEVAELIERRSATAAPAPAAAAPRVDRHSERGISLQEIVGAGVDGLARLQLGQVGELLDNHPHDPDLRALAEAAWTRAQDQAGGPVAALQRRDDATITARPGTAFAVLDLAAHFRLPLDPDDWTALLRLGWSGHQADEWLRSQLPPDAYERFDVTELDRPALLQAAWILPTASIPTHVATALVLRLADVDEQVAHRRYLIELADAGRDEVVRSVHATRPDDATWMALVRIGDCGAERQLLTEEATTDVPRRWPSAHQDHWLTHVRCRTSIDLLVDRIVQAESTDETDYSYLATLHDALHHAAGLSGLRVYDTLMDDRPYESAPFLWFRRAELLDKLLARNGRWDASADNLEILVALVTEDPA